MNLQQFKKSIFAAVAGLTWVWQQNKAFRFKVVAAVLVVLLAALVGVDRADFILVAMLIALVIALELLSALVGRVIGLFQPRTHEYIDSVKDIMAAIALLGSVFAAAMTIFILWPYFFEVFRR